ncbi:unnamed protein product, partial [Nesidiocoris tenuis]
VPRVPGSADEGEGSLSNREAPRLFILRYLRVLFSNSPSLDLILAKFELAMTRGTSFYLSIGFYSFRTTHQLKVLRRSK